MTRILTNLKESLYVAWVIAAKDVADALKNKTTRTNIIVIMGVVVFFYWSSAIRPYDKRIDVAVYDEGGADLFADSVDLEDGYSFRFLLMDSLQQMEKNMGYKELGVVVPADFDQALASGREANLTGYVLWVDRAQIAEKEATYSERFSEMFGQPVRLEIGENVVIPKSDIGASSVHIHLLYAVLVTAILVVPFLMLEEKQTKTLDALLVSPASAGQVVIGKALAGSFFALLGGGLFFALNWAAVTNWGLALLALFCCILFSVGVALALGSLIQSQRQVGLWALVVILVLLIPALLSGKPMLAPGLKRVFTWVPTTAVVKIFQFSVSDSAPLGQILSNGAIALGSTTLLYALLAWHVRRSDR